VFDKTTCQAVAAALRKHVKIADLAQTTPFHVENGRDRNNGLRYLAVSRKRTPTEGSASIRSKFSTMRDRGVTNPSSRKKRTSSSIAAPRVLTVTIPISLDNDLSGGSNDRAFWRISDCFNAMTIGVQHKSAVIIGVVLGAQPGRTIVPPTGGQDARKSPPEFIGIGVGTYELRCTADNRCNVMPAL
jgi:hypothetical protein